MKNTNLKGIFYIIITIIFSLIGCTNMILEYESVAGLKAIEIKEESKTFFEISGLCISSSMNIEKTIYYQKDDSLIVEIFLTIKRKVGSSGNFKEKILIDKPIKKILFGKKRK